MKIQSISICVPGGCYNRCKFCVSRMHTEKYANKIDRSHHDIYHEDYIKRLLFARDNGCNTLIITGAGEPLINKSFIEYFFELNNNLPNPFHWLEIQTSGATLDDEYLVFLRNGGVSTISLSLSSLFSDAENTKYNDPVKKEYSIKITELCAKIKSYDFNLRLSLNMTDFYNSTSPEEIFNRLVELKIDQVTFRILYKSGTDCEQDRWIDEHACDKNVINRITEYVKEQGSKLEVLPFGAIKYSVAGVSTVIDDDCMSKEVSDTLKYVILRENCKLYSKWDDSGSLIF